MKKILVPVDFSIYSEYALEVAAGLARGSKGEVVVLHMLGLADSTIMEDEIHDAAEARYFLKLARKRFETFLDKPALKGVPVKEIVQNYKIFSEISAVAKEHKADLIVMGSHGTGGMLEIFVGSHTEKVVRTSETPVLVIKHKTPDFKIKKVIYAMDYKLQNREAYQKAMDFFEKLEVEVHLVHVNLPNFQFMSTAQLKEEAAAFYRKTVTGKPMPRAREVFVADYSVEQGLYHYAEEVKADLIAVPTHGRSGLAHFFRGSIGEDVANHAPIPVLTFRA